MASSDAFRSQQKRCKVPASDACSRARTCMHARDCGARAGVPGMVGGMLRHMRSLRTMRRECADPPDSFLSVRACLMLCTCMHGARSPPGAAGRDSGSAAAAGHRESARDLVREGGAGGSADQLACQLGAVCGSLVRAQARCAGCMYTLQWLHGLPHCRTAWDREACVRTLVCAETRAVALQTRPAGPAWHSCDGAPHAISCAGRVQQKHTEVSRQCLFPPLLSVSTTLLPTRHKSRCPPASGAGVAVAGCGSL